MCINESLCSEIEVKIYKLGVKCNEVEVWFIVKYYKIYFFICLFVVYKIIKMGWRLINIIKSGKFMNFID